VASRILQRLKKQDNIGYLLVLPALGFFCAFVLVPAVLTFRLAFFEWDLFSPDMRFAGLENFRTLFSDPQIPVVLGNTVYFTVISVVLKVGLGVLLGNFVALSVKSRVGKFIMESAVFMPIVIPMSVVALIFGRLYDTEFGALNGLLGVFGAAPVGWLSDAKVALNSVIIIDVFKGLGFFFILSLVAVRNVPKTYYEAAAIDGAGAVTKFFRITLPQIGNTIVLLLVVATLSSFQIFDPLYILLNGVFGDTKVTISYMLWQQAFFYRNVGYAAVLAILIFMIVMGLTLFQLWLSKKLVNNDV
jgi:raffinose/stachyose/melibiose transport system permease protein